MILLLVGIVIGLYAGMTLMAIMSASKREDNIRNTT
jgi:flagellar basal body-associated protein FliL